MNYIEDDKLAKLLVKAYEEGWYGSKDCAAEAAGKIILDFKNENPEPKITKKKVAKRKVSKRTLSEDEHLFVRNQLQPPPAFGRGPDAFGRGPDDLGRGPDARPRSFRPSRTAAEGAWTSGSYPSEQDERPTWVNASAPVVQTPVSIRGPVLNDYVPNPVVAFGSVAPTPPAEEANLAALEQSLLRSQVQSMERTLRHTLGLDAEQPQVGFDNVDMHYNEMEPSGDEAV